MFAVGCHNCHCLLFFAWTRITTHIQLPVMRDEHQGLSTMPISKLGDRQGLVLCTHTNTQTYTYLHHGAKGYEIEIGVVVPDGYTLYYIQLLD